MITPPDISSARWLIVVLTVFQLISPFYSQAEERTLGWTANTETDLGAYRIYQRKHPNISYGSHIFEGLTDTPQSPSHTITGLLQNETYSFTVTAVDTSGNESGPAAEITDTIPGEFPPPSGSAIAINFQPATAPVPSGFQVDDGSQYTSARGYGWSSHRPQNTTDRNVIADQARDTYYYIQPGLTSTWRYDLANGDYLVTLVSGDSATTKGPHQVLIEGSPVISGQVTAANQFITVDQHPVTIIDGTLTVTIGGLGGNTMLNYLEITPTGGGSSPPPPPPPPSGSAIAINFQPATAPVPSGFQVDDGSQYTSARGYGWSSHRPQNTTDRNVIADQARDTYYYIQPGLTSTWRYDLANGDYLVTLVSGDSATTKGPHQVLIEGSPVISGQVTAANQFITVDQHPVTIIDGTLTVTIGGLGGNTMLNYLEITPTGGGSSPPPPPPPPSGSAIAINFQPATAPVPSGFQVDDGSQYTSARGYGWSSHRPQNTTDRNVIADQARDTYYYIQPGLTSTWRYDLANGDYLVTLVSGDSATTKGPHQVLIEGSPVISGQVTAANQFITVDQHPVTIIDGTLTVTIGGLGGNTMLNYLEITPTGGGSSPPPPPPPPSGSAIAINFQPATAPVPSGFQVDDGSQYTSARGYGWSSHRPQNTTDRNVIADQARDTYYYIQPGLTSTWRYDLANGDYLVTLVSGDSATTKGPHQVLIEGSPVISGQVTAANQFITVDQHPVTIIDGTLTVTIGGLGGNTMLNYLEITPK